MEISRQGVADELARHASLQTRHELGVAFAIFEAAHVLGVKPVDKDPQEYIAEHAPGRD